MNDNIRKRRVAMIGIGDIANKVYLPLLAHHEHAEVVGVMSRSEETVQHAAARFRFQNATTNLNALLSWDVDAVFVHSPTATHYETVKTCLMHGLPVYVDKPLSGDLSECRELAALAENKGLLLAVGFNRRFAPLYREAKAWMQAAGGFDQVTALKHRTRQQSSSSRETVFDDLIHMLDLLLWLGGDDYKLASHQLAQDKEGRLLHASGVMSFQDARYGSYGMVRQSGTDLEKLELHGSGRSVEVTNLEQAVLYENGALPVTKTFGSWDTILERRGFAGAVDHFLECIGSPEHCSIRADQVMSSHELAAKVCDNR
ncbi:Gfo/Idh/MocA family oxidoreductase [Paenibacillus dokdonensis]|uniref:Gfo/Idh/MocA family oxidoreductase n=1 Tax=Paenibacillus dokdonensis TaxID=2567944 RepID=A0ABU6GUS5_9BACL|nr:Gfo/Idh/MocA family oxidoreductase [Paenibacillus dokdonensis]MEC0243499.1 Gfo/Idh/MocA family oxidoreductase [Paenibacillus dokdonensis]